MAYRAVRVHATLCGVQCVAPHFYGQNNNYLLEPHDVVDRTSVDAFLERLLKEQGHFIPDYEASKHMARQLYIKV